MSYKRSAIVLPVVVSGIPLCPANVPLLSPLEFPRGFRYALQAFRYCPSGALYLQAFRYCPLCPASVPLLSPLEFPRGFRYALQAFRYVLQAFRYCGL